MKRLGQEVLPARIDTRVGSPVNESRAYFCSPLDRITSLPIDLDAPPRSGLRCKV